MVSPARLPVLEVVVAASPSRIRNPHTAPTRAPTRATATTSHHHHSGSAPLTLLMENASAAPDSTVSTMGFHRCNTADAADIRTSPRRHVNLTQNDLVPINISTPIAGCIFAACRNAFASLRTGQLSLHARCLQKQKRGVELHQSAHRFPRPPSRPPRRAPHQSTTTSQAAIIRGSLTWSYCSAEENLVRALTMLNVTTSGR